MIQELEPLSIDRLLAVMFWPSLVLAWADGFVVPASALGLPPFVARAALAITIAFATVHFVRMLFDGATRRALNVYNNEVLKRFSGKMSRDELKSMRRTIFESLEHGWALLWTTAILCCEAVAAQLFQWHALLAFMGGWMTGIMLLLQMKTVPILAKSGSV